MSFQYMISAISFQFYHIWTDNFVIGHSAYWTGPFFHSRIRTQPHLDLFHSFHSSLFQRSIGYQIIIIISVFAFLSVNIYTKSCYSRFVFRTTTERFFFLKWNLKIECKRPTNVSYNGIGNIKPPLFSNAYLDMFAWNTLRFALHFLLNCNHRNNNNFYWKWIGGL